MIRGLYTSGWSMLANSRKMDVITNNLANAGTNGFKKDTVVFESFPSVLTKRIYDTMSSSNPTGEVGTMELGSDVGEIFTYYNQGQLQKTNNNFDLAIQGADTAFFSIGVTDENGNTKELYTRDGSFVINQERKLVTKDGHEVLGEDGPIYLEGEQFSVEADGTIIQNDREVGRLKLRSFIDQGVLRKAGANLLEAPEDADTQEFTGLVAQGYLEQSNVNIVKEMVDMITVMRAYEANQKILQAQDGTLQKAVTEVGAIR